MADRYFCSYFMIALLIERGVDFVTRVHQRRTVDFRRGRRLSQGDHLVTWTRPIKPAWMDQETYDRMPRSIEVREVAVHVDQPGFRTESFAVVTTLTDAARLAEVELENLAGYTIGDRPGRAEPRAMKRRPKPHDLLTQPRDKARAELLKVKSS